MPCGRCVSCMAAICIFFLVSSRITPSCIVVEIKLSVFTARILSVLYRGLLLNVVCLLHHVAKVSVPAFLFSCSFSGVCLDLGAML